MFWRFGFQPSSASIESLLDSADGPSLWTLLDDPDILQEVRAGNGRLVGFLSRKEVVETLVKCVKGEVEGPPPTTNTNVDVPIPPAPGSPSLGDPAPTTPAPIENNPQPTLPSAAPSPELAAQTAADTPDPVQEPTPAPSPQPFDAPIDASEDNPDPGKTRPPIIAELFSLEDPHISTTLCSHEDILIDLWCFLKAGMSEIDEGRASAWGRVVQVALGSPGSELLDLLIRHEPPLIPLLLPHLSISSISDLLLRLVALAADTSAMDPPSPDIDSLATPDSAANPSPPSMSPDAPISARLSAHLTSLNILPSLVSFLGPSNPPATTLGASTLLLDIVATCYQPPPSDPPPIDTSDDMGANTSGELPSSPVAHFAKPVFGGHPLARPLKSVPTLWHLTSHMKPPTPAPPTHSSLTASSPLLVELLRRLCSDVETAEAALSARPAGSWVSGPPPPANVLGTPGCIGGGLGGGLPGIDQGKLERLASELAGCVAVVEGRVAEIAGVVKNGWPSPGGGVVVHAGPVGVEPPNPAHPTPSADASIATTDLSPSVSPAPPSRGALGAPRLRCCEVLAEILHLSYLLTSSPVWDALATWRLQPLGDFADLPGSKEWPEARTMGDALVGVLDEIANEGVVAECVALFFAHPWNNLLHSVVYDMVAKIFNAYTFLSSLPTPSSPSTPTHPSLVPGSPPSSIPLPTPPVQTPVRFKLGELKRAVRRLVVQVLGDGRIVERIGEAQRWNDWAVQQPRGYRLGHMGHLTHVADEVIKLWERCAEELEPECGASFKSDAWLNFTSITLPSTRARDTAPLGGSRPAPPVGAGLHLGDAQGLEEADVGLHVGAASGKRADGEDEVGLGGFGDDATADQFARFLVQRMVSDLPTDAIMSSMTAAAGSSWSSDDDTDSDEGEEIGYRTNLEPDTSGEPVMLGEGGAKSAKEWKSRDWLTNELEDAVNSGVGQGVDEGFKIVSADNLSVGSASILSTASFADDQTGTLSSQGGTTSPDQSVVTPTRHRQSPLRTVQAAVDEDDDEEDDDLDTGPPAPNDGVPSTFDSGFLSAASAGGSAVTRPFSPSFTSGDAWVADFQAAFPGATPLDVQTGGVLTPATGTPITSPSESPTSGVAGFSFGEAGGGGDQGNWADFSKFETTFGEVQQDGQETKPDVPNQSEVGANEPESG
ncbi:hypothetical protein M427DRAFT_154045 [Gonapodya prolifera JEL478]|uniref:SAPS-domain-containing protein n=1 Tax=Gonapodya prolifera (strain JEL478) TaxID=1344416 RepID=A0A139AL65_GONPJ|nr:hypothetical protein M427DRAFT_154045 [Gonapodya prolifera JEL478]|eukprot:KXS17264.1 hypothetical protein M427DRAFT_154045 [Gonapodya prolifera JEL478]